MMNTREFFKAVARMRELQKAFGSGEPCEEDMKAAVEAVDMEIERAMPILRSKEESERKMAEAIEKLKPLGVKKII